MLSDVEMNNLSSVMANNKEAVQQVEGDRRDSEKIHGSDHFAIGRSGQGRYEARRETEAKHIADRTPLHFWGVRVPTAQRAFLAA